MEAILQLEAAMGPLHYGILLDKRVFENIPVHFFFFFLQVLMCFLHLYVMFVMLELIPLGHKARVGSLSWSHSPRWLLSSGSRDRSILNRDVRVASEYVSKYSSHKQEVLII